MQYIVDRKNKEIAQLNLELKNAKAEVQMFKDLRNHDREWHEGFRRELNGELQATKLALKRTKTRLTAFAILLAVVAHAIGYIAGTFLP